MSTAWPTTSAPNRPPRSSGSDAAPRAAWAPAAAGPGCTNCGSPLVGPYCSACGQRDLPFNPSARVLVGELWDTFGTVDGKLVRTTALLVARPGALTVEWLRGRRAPYLRPLSLYLTVSAAYFTALAATFRPQEFRKPWSAQEERETTAFRTKFERKYATAATPVRVTLIGLARLGADPVGGVSAALPSVPRLMFVLVPLFALLVQRTFPRRGWRYPAHFYFALHVFAFYFAASTADRLAAAYGPPWLRSPANWAVGVGTLAYLGVAMRRVYGGRWWALAVRVVAVAIPFSVAAVAGLLLDAVIVAGTR